MEKQPSGATSLIEYEKTRNYERVEEWLADSVKTALGSDSKCRKTGFGSFESRQSEFPGCSAYHAFYPIACEIFPQGPMQHFDWWVSRMRESLKGVDHKPNIWIPATSTPVMVEIAMEACGKEANYVVSDLCGTPLEVIERAFGKSVLTFKSDIFEPNYWLWRGFLGGDIDIIATDAFITRFEPEKIEKIYRTFHSALRPGGHLLTTIRHPMEEEAGGLQALEREGATAQYTTLVAKAWAMFCRDHPGAERIVDGELLKELASVYTENMKSRHGKDEEAERLYAKSALSLAAFHDVSVPPGPGYAQGVVMALRGGLKPIKCELSLPCLDISPRQCQLWDLQRPKEEN